MVYDDIGVSIVNGISGDVMEITRCVFLEGEMIFIWVDDIGIFFGIVVVERLVGMRILF